MRLFCLFLQCINVKKIIMDTLTRAFDDRNQASVSSDRRYRISPAIKAMEAGISIPDSISDNYKKESVEIRTKRYL